MEIVGDRFAKSEYFISSLLFAGKLLKTITEKSNKTSPKKSRLNV
ncbi:MAG: hypothetical protein QXQ94_09210 [Candidatus Bathyarchaeia archaeon]